MRVNRRGWPTDRSRRSRDRRLAFAFVGVSKASTSPSGPANSRLHRARAPARAFEVVAGRQFVAEPDARTDRPRRPAASYRRRCVPDDGIALCADDPAGERREVAETGAAAHLDNPCAEPSELLDRSVIARAPRRRPLRSAFASTASASRRRRAAMCAADRPARGAASGGRAVGPLQEVEEDRGVPTQRVIGPGVSSVGASGNTPLTLIRDRRLQPGDAAARKPAGAPNLRCRYRWPRARGGGDGDARPAARAARAARHREVPRVLHGVPMCSLVPQPAHWNSTVWVLPRTITRRR